MKKNIGTTDRIIRLILALIIFTFAFLNKNWILAIAGLFVLYEALSSWCVLYAIIGRNTCPVNKR